MMNSDERAEYEQALEDTSVKALLIEQNALLHQILLALQPETESESEYYKCTMCQAEILEGELEHHAISDHNAPPNQDLSTLYEPV